MKNIFLNFKKINSDQENIFKIRQNNLLKKNNFKKILKINFDVGFIFLNSKSQF